MTVTGLVLAQTTLRLGIEHLNSLAAFLRGHGLLDRTGLVPAFQASPAQHRDVKAINKYASPRCTSHTRQRQILPCAALPRQPAGTCHTHGADTQLQDGGLPIQAVQQQRQHQQRPKSRITGNWHGCAAYSLLSGW